MTREPWWLHRESLRQTRRWRVFRVVTGWWAVPQLGVGSHCYRTWREAFDHALRDGRDL